MRRHPTLRALVSTGATVAAIVVAAEAVAARLVVTVATTGRPTAVAGAEVSLSAPELGKLPRTATTERTGVAVFDRLPALSGALSVTADGYQPGRAKVFIPTSDSTVDVDVFLDPQSQRPTAVPTPSPVPEPLEMRSFRINDGSSETDSLLVSLDHDLVSGDPTHYRVATSPDFAGADWHAYTAIPVYTFPAGTFGEQRLFFQVARRVGSFSDSQMSDVGSDTILIVGQVVEHEVPAGTAMRHAEQQGWRFRTFPGADTEPAWVEIREGFGVGGASIELEVRPVPWPAPAFNPGGTARFTLFEGPELTDGWRLVRAVAEVAHMPVIVNGGMPAGEWSMEQPFPPLPSVSLTVTRLPDSSAPAPGPGALVILTEGMVVRVSKIVLEGPANRDWQDAFRR